MKKQSRPHFRPSPFSAVVEENLDDESGAIDDGRPNVLLRMPEPPKENSKTRLEAVADYTTRKVFDSGNAFARIGKLVNYDTIGIKN